MQYLLRNLVEWFAGAYQSLTFMKKLCINAVLVKILLGKRKDKWILSLFYFSSKKYIYFFF